MSQNLCSYCMFNYFFSLILFDNFYWFVSNSLIFSAVFSLLLNYWINCSFLIISLQIWNVLFSTSLLKFSCVYMSLSFNIVSLFILRGFMSSDIQCSWEYCLLFTMSSTFSNQLENKKKEKKGLFEWKKGLRWRHIASVPLK